MPKFIIDRASVWQNAIPPCISAVFHGGDGDDSLWHVQIDCIEDLMNLINENGKLIISADHITIYDSWVE